MEVRLYYLISETGIEYPIALPVVPNKTYDHNTLAGGKVSAPEYLGLTYDHIKTLYQYISPISIFERLQDGREYTLKGTDIKLRRAKSVGRRPIKNVINIPGLYTYPVYSGTETGAVYATFTNSENGRYKRVDISSDGGVHSGCYFIDEKYHEGYHGETYGVELWKIGGDFQYFAIFEGTGAMVVNRSRQVSSIPEVFYNTKSTLLTPNHTHAGSVSFLTGEDIKDAYYTTVDIFNIVEEKKGKNIMDRFAPVTQSNGTGVYALEKRELWNLFKNLYNTTIAESIGSLFGVVGDGRLIQSLRWFYGIKGDIRLNNEKSIINIGTREMSGDDVTATGTVVMTEYVYKESSVFTVTPRFNNYLDYSPYTKYFVHIPFTGYVELQGSDIIGKSLKIAYHIDLISGSALAFIQEVQGTSVIRNITTVPVTMGVDIPLQTDSKNPLGAVTGLTQSALSVVSPMVGGAVGIAGLMMSGEIASPSHTGHSVGIGYLDNLEHFMLIIRPVIGSRDTLTAIGKPVEVLGRVGDYTGFVKTGNITEMGDCMYKEKIAELLKQGVYL